MHQVLHAFAAFLNRPITIGGKTTSDVRWKPCSYDCYDDGGCASCSEFHAWSDPAYGRLGRWFPKSGDHAYSGVRGLSWQELRREEIEELEDYIESRHEDVFSGRSLA